MTISLDGALALLALAPPPADDDDDAAPRSRAVRAAAYGALGAVGRGGETIGRLGPAGEAGDLVEESVDSPVPTSHEAYEDGVAWQVAAFAETLRHDVASFRLRLAHWEPEARADAVVPPESFNDGRPHARRRDEAG